MNRKLSLSLLVFSLLGFLFLASDYQSTPSGNRMVDIQRDTTYLNPGKYIFGAEPSEWVRKTLESMTLAEKIGQLVIPQAYGRDFADSSSAFLGYKALVDSYYVGGFVFFQSNLPEQSKIINKLQGFSKVPLLFSADYENGAGMRTRQATKFPNLMALGAADDSLLTYEMGKIIAREARKIGIVQNYAPVVDINNNPDNPIINTRSIGEDREMVTRLAGALVRGMQDGKLAATLKHFPGHGNTSIDSHNETAVINVNQKQFEQNELYPFKKLIDEGVISVMVGHIRIPQVLTDDLPGTLSSQTVTDLLQKRLGFTGLAVTDAMSMHAISKNYSDSLAALKSLLAGCDLLLFPPDARKVIQSLISSVKAGLIEEKRIEKSVIKILQLKEWAGLTNYQNIPDDEHPSTVTSLYATRVAETIAKKSITLAKDKKKLIPIYPGTKKKYYHLIITENDNDKGQFFDSLLQNDGIISARGFISKRTNNKQIKSIIRDIQRNDILIISVYNSISSFKGSRDFSSGIKKQAAKINRIKKQKILLSHSDPYIYDLFPSAETYMLSYGDSEYSESALYKALTGRNSIGGKLPVSIPSAKLNMGEGLIRKAALLEYPAQSLFDFSTVDSIIQKGIKDSVAPAMALLVIKDGDVIYEKYAGRLTYLPDALPITDSTIFDLASVSKVVATTTAAMICVDRKLFSLDDKVIKFFPKFKVKGKESITIRNLLTHTSGLPAFKKYYELVKNEKELMEDIFNSSISFEPGTQMVYSDLGMITLGKIIEKVTGKTLDQFCKREIFTPLQMTNTFYKPVAALKHRIAPTEYDDYWRNRLLIGEVHDEASSMLGGVAGHAGLFSTARDLGIFLQMLLQGGEYGKIKIVKSTTANIFTKQQSNLSSRALGWDTKDGEGYSSAGTLFHSDSYGHTGYTGTSVWTDPTRKLIVILLTNRVHPTRLNRQIMKFRPIIHDAIVNAIEK